MWRYSGSWEWFRRIQNEILHNFQLELLPEFLYERTYLNKTVIFDMLQETVGPPGPVGPWAHRALGPGP